MAYSNIGAVLLASRRARAVWLLESLGFDKLSPDSFRDRLIVQKALYLAQACGIDLGYRFKWHARGPYSKGLARDMRMGFSVKPEPLVNVDGCLDKAKRLIYRLRSLPGDESYWFEVAASLHMLAKGVYPPSRNPVDELVSRKPYIKRDDAELVYSILREEKLL